MWLFMWHILKTIGKSQLWNLGISTDTAKFTNVTFVLIYLVPVSITYNYSYLYDLLFIRPEASIGVVEQRVVYIFGVPVR